MVTYARAVAILQDVAREEFTSVNDSSQLQSSAVTVRFVSSSSGNG